MISLREVSLSFKARKGAFSRGIHHVLRNVNLDLFPGETLGIVGRNGCGKTTILRVISGILAPTSGQAYKKAGISTALLTIGLGFRPDLTGRDNALLSAVLQGATRSQAESYLGDIKEFSELGDSFEEQVKTYSSGMRSRLGFTTALFTHVDVLLIDEVLSVGDAHFRHKAQTAMKEKISGEQTVVYVSHSEKEVAALCDRAVWINEARIEAQGDPADVLKKYRKYVHSLDSRN